MQRKTQWTLVQHSGYGYAGKEGFRRGLETRSINTAAEAKRVTNAGGMLFDSYSKAEDLADAENGRGGLYPRCGGSFSRSKVDGLAIWVPEPDSGELHCIRCGSVLHYRATLGAPGVGQSWECSNGHTIIKVGATLYDPTMTEDEEPPWVLTPDECI